MNSERHRVQVEIETRIGCTEGKVLNQYQNQFDGFKILHADIDVFREASRIDMLAYTEKGVATFLQALKDLDQGLTLWSCVKLYYSVYFLQRALLLDSGVAIVRCKSIYTLTISPAELPKKVTGRNTQSDHKATIKIYSEKFENSDILLSQTINGMDPVSWLCERREWANYRRRQLLDGNQISGLDNTNTQFFHQIHDTCHDNIPVLCFLEDIACLTFPTKFCQLALHRLGLSGDFVSQMADRIAANSGESSLIRSFADNHKIMP